MITLRDIADALGRPVIGDGAIPLDGAAEPAAAGPRDLALAMSPRYAEGLAAGRARAALLWDGADPAEHGLDGAVTVARPRLAMASVTRALDPGPEVAEGVHPAAIVHPSATIGPEARIGPFVTIGRDARIGARARVMERVSVGPGAVIGEDATLMSGAVVGHGVRIGDRFVGQAGSVVGGDGLAFVTPQESGVERARKSLGDQGEITAQAWTRIHSLGTVVVGDDVELGCNSCIDRGTIAATTVGRGTKIDNLVHIGHNCSVGEDCLLCMGVGIAGSTKVGDRVVLAGQVGVSDNIEIGDDVVTGGGTKIFTRIPAGKVVWGFPAVDMEMHIRLQKHMRRLPRLGEQLAELRATVTKLVQGRDADGRGRSADEGRDDA